MVTLTPAQMLASEIEESSRSQKISLAFDRETLHAYKDGVCLLVDICTQLLLTDNTTSNTQSAAIQLQLKTLVCGL